MKIIISTISYICQNFRLNACLSYHMCRAPAWRSADHEFKPPDRQEKKNRANEKKVDCSEVKNIERGKKRKKRDN